MYTKILWCSFLLGLASNTAASAAVRSRVVGPKIITSSPNGKVLPLAGTNYAPTAMSDFGTYRMWWCMSMPDSPTWIDTIYYASTTDPSGLNWSNVQIALQPSPLRQVCDPSVVKVGSTYYMYVTGSPAGDSNGAVYLATSTNGITFTKYPNDNSPIPIIPNYANDGNYGMGQPSVLYLNGKFVMYYTQFINSEQGGLYRQESWDGVTFTGKTFIMAVNDVDIKYDPGQSVYIMVRGGQNDDSSKAHLHVSVDGYSWTQVDNSKVAMIEPNHIGRQHCEGPGMLGNIDGTAWTNSWLLCGHGLPGDRLSYRIHKGALSWSSTLTNGIYRFYTTAGFQDHFYSLNGDSPSYYDYEGKAYRSPSSSDPGATPFYRMRYSSPPWHLYTSSWSEVQALLAVGWILEGTEGYVGTYQTSGTSPLYRMYNPSTKDRLYTTSLSERNAAYSLGFVDEGIAGYVYPAQ